MTGYTKLFGSILASTIWEESKETKILWVTMLAMADKRGEVHASVPGLATLARLSREETDAALLDLMSPDPDSRTKAAEGRRVEVIEGGWRLINHGKYRALMNAEERKEYNAAKKRESRARQKVSANVRKRPTLSAVSAHAEATPEANTTSTSPRQEVMEAWNSLGTPFPKVVALSPDRNKELGARLKDEWWVQNYREALEVIRNSKFCRGEVATEPGRKRWIADFDFFIRPGSVAKALEGKYKNDKEKACTV